MEVDYLTNRSIFYDCCFLQGKEIRNSVSHSVSFKVTDDVLDKYINDMITLLEDPTELLHDDQAQIAVKQLRQVSTSN